MSSKGKPREGVTSTEAGVALGCNALDGGFNSSWSSQERGSRKDLSKKQTHVGLKSCHEAEKTQGSTQRKLNNIEKYINKNRTKKYSLSLSCLPESPQVCKLELLTLLGVCFYFFY